MELNDAAEGVASTSLEAIDARLARIERMLAPLGEVMALAPGAVATSVDSLDAWVQQEGRGVDRVQALRRFLSLATEPATLDGLGQLLRALQEIPGIAATLGDTVDAWAERDGHAEQRLRALQSLLRQASDPTVLESLAAMLEQVKALPSGVAVAVDAFDSWAQRDGQLEGRLRGLQELFAVVTEPEVLAQATRSLQQVRAVPGLLATAGDWLDDLAARDGQLNTRLAGLRELLARLTDPQVLATCNALLAALPQVPGLGATLVDALDDLAADAQRAGVGPEEVLQSLRQVARNALHVVLSPELKSLLDRGASPGMLGMLTRAVTALEQAQTQAQPIGAWGALKATGDAAVRHSLGFMVTAARNFGAAMQHNATQHGANTKQLSNGKR